MSSESFRPYAALVVWFDHVKTDEDPSNENMGPIKRNTVGWVIEENDEYVVTAHSLDENPVKVSYEYGFGIAKVMVESITSLDAPKTATRKGAGK
jgi:hypothetical protein